jgi:hypothetical protein
MSTRQYFFPVLSLVLVILMAGSWWLGRRSVQTLQPRPAETNTPGTMAPTARDKEPEARTMAVVLSRGLVRGNEKQSNPLVIPPEVTQVRLEARVDVDYPHYKAVLKTPEGKQIWSKGDVEVQAFSGGKRILLYLSKDLSPPGDYMLTILGLPTAKSPEIAAEYGFRIGSR